MRRLEGRREHSAPQDEEDFNGRPTTTGNVLCPFELPFFLL